MTTTILMPDSAVGRSPLRDDALEMTSSTGVELLWAGGDCCEEPAPDGNAGLRRLVNEIDEQPVPLLSADLPRSVLEPEASIGMTEDDTVCVLEVLAEMQRIIDRHLEKTDKE
jgi:hypothetical protein